MTVFIVGASWSMLKRVFSTRDAAVDFIEDYFEPGDRDTVKIEEVEVDAR